jgi:hypothetical protein
VGVATPINAISTFIESLPWLASCRASLQSRMQVRVHDQPGEGRLGKKGIIVIS